MKIAPQYVLTFGKIGFFFLLFTMPAAAQSPVIDKFHIEVPGADPLEIYRFSPEGAVGPLPAIILFHGGAWSKGSPKQMFPIARQFAEFGMIAYAAEYRLIGSSASTIRDCVEDAHRAFQWLHNSAQEQGVNPDKIYVGGGSAGGHLALCTLVFYDRAAHVQPRGFFGLNPVVTSKEERFRKVFGDLANTFDPAGSLDRLNAPLPRAMILHGNEDEVVPIQTVQEFQQKADAIGSNVELIVFDGAKHGFFNPALVTPEQQELLRRAISSFAKEALEN